MSMLARRDVFQAIADPTRREIIELIATREMNLNSIAENFSSTRSAISQHIKILTECGLIIIKKQGRERYCEARLQKLDLVAEWAERYRKLWAEKFESLDELLERLKVSEEKKNNKQRAKRKPKGGGKT